MNDFYQEPPRLKNTFTYHRWLRSLLRHKIAKTFWSDVEADLTQLGERCRGEYLSLSRQAERDKPHLEAFDPWGKRVDRVHVSMAWQELHRAAAREGLLAIAYERNQGEYSRLYQFAKLYLFHPSSAFFTWPLATSDAAARILANDQCRGPLADAFAHLTSRDPERFWTAGQWLSERSGGNDVSGTETRVEWEGDQPRLYGVKWFASSPTSQMALTLARLPDSPATGNGLTLFYVPTHYPSGEANHIRILRFKDKLGTWGLPTAELEFNGAYAYPIGDRDMGLKFVASMANVTRLHNSICALGQMTRALELMQDYSSKRIAFGQPLNAHILHVATFAQEEVRLLAGMLLTLELVHLLGREDCARATGTELEVLRLLTPVCKVFTARSAVQVASEVVEGFGGAGYVEDTGIPAHLRDAQVFPLSEGTSNVLSLEMLRVLQSSRAFAALKEESMVRLKNLRSAELFAFRDQTQTRLQSLELRLSAWATKASPDEHAASARDLAFYLAWLYSSVLALTWIDQESSQNRTRLLPWVAALLKNVGEWKPREVDEIQRSTQIWSTLLEP